MRAHPWLLVLLVGCKPSATVERTMPVANLQSHRTVALRVHTSAFAAQGQAVFLENAVTQKLKQKCSFDQIGRPPAGVKPDLVLDLNITKIARGGGGLISNPNLAVVDTLLVLTDGQDGDLLGTATIHGKSSGMLVNNNNPETQAIEVTAQSIADMLAKSGCSGPRIAKAEPPPVTNPNTSTGNPNTGNPNTGNPNTGNPNTGNPNTGNPNTGNPPVDDKARAEAEALNDQGKEKLYAADLPGALALFQQANAKVPDAKYGFNICLTFAAQEKWTESMNACKAARAMNPPAALAAKIDQKVTVLQDRMSR